MEEVEDLARIAANAAYNEGPGRSTWDKEARHGYSERIERLREIYRESPALFDPSLVKWIKRLADQAGMGP
ncbi:MAG: ATP-dependent DNA helicase RecQ, partial [Nitrospiria bacterium]